MFAMVLAVTPACIDNSIPIGFEDTGRPLDASSPLPEGSEDSDEKDLFRHVVLNHSAGQLPLNAATASPSNDAECGADDLLFEAEVRDSLGEAVEEGFSIDEHRLWARVYNPCTSAVVFDTERRCLVEGWRIEVQGALSTAAFPCGGTGGARTVAADAFIEQEVMPLHDLAEGEYTFSIVFGHAPHMDDDLFEAAVDFEVLSRAFPQAPR